MHRVIECLVDAESFFEMKPLFAPELVVGLGRMDGRPVGVVANNPAAKGGVLFVDSADKAARFIWCCDAFNIPLVFLADVPGFMIGTEVERQGIIRHGAKMITAVSEATVPKVSVIVRKAYGAGLYAMSGPAFDPEATIALPTAKIAVMGPEAAVNAVFANKIAAIEDPGRAGCVRRGAAADLRGRRRPVAAGVGAGDRRHRRLGGSPGRGRAPPAARRRARPDTSPIAATACHRSEVVVMPWCEECARFYNPNTLDEEGDCPSRATTWPTRPTGARRRAPGVPWHFWLLLAALSIYLGWRLIQGIGWVIGKL